MYRVGIFAIAVYLISVAPLQARSIDCNNVRLDAEFIICEYSYLVNYDRRMTNLYVRARRLVRSDFNLSDALLRNQRAWLRRRNRCKNQYCLSDRYQERIRWLNAYIRRHQPRTNPACRGKKFSISGYARTEHGAEDLAVTGWERCVARHCGSRWASWSRATRRNVDCYRINNRQHLHRRSRPAPLKCQRIGDTLRGNYQCTVSGYPRR